MHQIANSLDPLGWILLFAGWLMYWLKNLDQAKQTNKKGENPSWFNSFVYDNMLEFPISLLACIILAILADQIPTDIIDMKGRISTLIAGYSASSILNGLITRVKG